MPDRWDVYRVNFGRRIGREPAGIHRAVVVSNDGFNHNTPFVTVCPITGSRRDLYQCEVRLAAGGPLDVDSIIQVQYVLTIEDHHLGERLGQVLDPAIRDLVERALRTLLALDVAP